MDDEGFVVAALPPVVEAVRMVCESRRFHCGWPVYGPAGTGDHLTITSAEAKGAGRLRNPQCPPACAEAIVRKGEWAPARRRVRAQKPMAFDRLSDWL